MRIGSVCGCPAVAMALIGVLALSMAAAKEKELPGKALFEKMVGKWTSEGELTPANSGDVIYITEKWSGKFTDEGKGFIIEGDRDWNGEEQTFKWEYSYNAATDLVEVVYSASNFEEDLSVEVSVNEVEGMILLRASVGDDGAEFQIDKRFKKGELATSVVTVIGGNGQTVMDGEIKHKREK